MRVPRGACCVNCSTSALLPAPASPLTNAILPARVPASRRYCASSSSCGWRSRRSTPGVSGKPPRLGTGDAFWGYRARNLGASAAVALQCSDAVPASASARLSGGSLRRRGEDLVLDQHAYPARPTVLAARKVGALLIEQPAGVRIADLDQHVVVGLGDALDHPEERLIRTELEGEGGLAAVAVAEPRLGCLARIDHAVAARLRQLLARRLAHLDQGGRLAGALAEQHLGGGGIDQLEGEHGDAHRCRGRRRRPRCAAADAQGGERED